MSFLRGSANYVWCTTSVLGKGATGAVFQGVNKNNGEPVAVKTFNQLSHMRPHDVQVREFEVLKKVKHENIVKLLAIEEEQEGRGKVIVMELCTGGSLFNILDDPENTYGLQESEFLLVLEHLSAGMKHLRDNSLVHRDLKPGNIMKFIKDDGTTVYKLTDFGAARELEEDQQFMSLYGTEEYLHPDMYERAVLRKPVGKTFGATVDLWSIGVTLYHVATGNLPFRPFGGRRNKETMYYITTKKASGVISGTQTSENGPIEWGKDLPSNCQLSAGLKKLVTPLLAGLLEVDSQRIWNFEKFFSEVTGILSRKVVHIFHVNRAQCLKIYLHPDATYEEFQCLVLEQTDVSPNNQILLHQDNILLTEIEESTPGRGYPETDEDEPLMLFSKENNNVTLVSEADMPKFPTFPNLISVENDASLAKSACSVGHVCKRRIEKFSRCSRLIHLCVNQFTSLVCKDLEKVAAKSDKLCEITRCVDKLTDAVMRSGDSVLKLAKHLSCSVTNLHSVDWRSELTNLRKNEMDPAIQQLHQRYVTERTLQREWTSATRSMPCPAKSRAPARARTLLDRLRDSWQHLVRDRATRSLTYNDEQFHVLEKIKVGETGRRVRALLETECQPAVAQLADSLADWYKMAQTVYLQAQILDKDTEDYENRLDMFVSRVANGDSVFHSSVRDTLEKLEKDRKIPRTLGKQVSRIRNDAKIIRNSLKDIVVIQEEMASEMKENTDLINKLEQFTLSVGAIGSGAGD
ncbi:hypothetical protein R5R35_005504 [Gryllus longicercus]